MTRIGDSKGKEDVPVSICSVTLMTDIIYGCLSVFAGLSDGLWLSIAKGCAGLDPLQETLRTMIISTYDHF